MSDLEDLMARIDIMGEARGGEDIGARRRIAPKRRIQAMSPPVPAPRRNIPPREDISERRRLSPKRRIQGMSPPVPAPRRRNLPMPAVSPPVGADLGARMKIIPKKRLSPQMPSMIVDESSEDEEYGGGKLIDTLKRLTLEEDVEERSEPTRKVPRRKRGKETESESESRVRVRVGN